MNRITGIFKGLTSRKGEGKRGPWTLYTVNVEVNGKERKFNAGFKKPSIRVNEGDSVEVILEKEGDYDRVVDVIPASNSNSNTSSESGNGNGNGQKYDPNIQDRIVRQFAFQYAMEIVNSVYSDPNAKQRKNPAERMSLAVALADHIVQYISTGFVEPIKMEDLTKKQTVAGE